LTAGNIRTLAVNPAEIVVSHARISDIQKYSGKWTRWEGVVLLVATSKQKLLGQMYNHTLGLGSFPVVYSVVLNIQESWPYKQHDI